MVKCLTGRPKTVEKAQAAFMLWVELEAVDVFLVCFITPSLPDLDFTLYFPKSVPKTVDLGFFSRGQKPQ